MPHLFRYGLYILIILSAFSLFNCQSMNRSPGPVVRDVPFEARGEEGVRHRIFVLPFLDERGDRPQRLLEEARQTVIRELLKTNQFVVTPTSDFPHDPAKFIIDQREYDLQQIAKLMSGLGVAAVVEGKIMDIRARRQGDSFGLIRQSKAQAQAEIRVRVFAVRNGKELLVETRSGEADVTSTRLGSHSQGDHLLLEDPELVRSAVRKAFLATTPQLVRAMEKLNWEGRVAMVSGERIFINAGRLTGIQVGDILKVLEQGEEVFDPETGVFIGAAPGRMKGTIEIISYFGRDGSVGVVHSGSGFRENDRVELY